MTKKFQNFNFQNLAIGIWTLIIILIGCSSHPPRKTNAVEIGMPRREVILLLGTPAEQYQEGNREVLQFALHTSLNQSYVPDEPFWVFLEEGKVVRFGRGKDFMPAATHAGDESSQS